MNSFWQIGKSYFIRSVTMHYVGMLTDFNEKEVFLEKASWVADSGRFHDALKTGELSEVEPFISKIMINRDSIVDATEWDHDLPIKQI